MKCSAAILIAILIGTTVPCEVDASIAPLVNSMQGADVDTGADLQEIWSTEIHGKDVYFYLSEADFGRDFAVFRTGDSEKEWQLLRWVKRDGGVELLTLSGRREELLPEWASSAVVVGDFPVKRTGGRYRIKVTSLFGLAYPAGWGRSEEPAGIRGREFETPKVFPKNVVIRREFGSRFGDPNATWIRWNFVRLPDVRMDTRFVRDASAFAPRGGWLAKHNFPRRLVPDEVIMRWRLDGRKLQGELAEPDSPIMLYVDPATPERWRSWVAAGIESWQSAFEAIGYRRAVRAVMPAIEGGVDYDDVRKSVLCWKSQKLGCDGYVFDPRTGEILQFHIGGQDYALEGHLAQYIVALAAVDRRTLEGPLPDALLGALVQKVAAHETGHVLGLRDGNYGVFEYSSTQLRDVAWVTANTFAPSVMNYSRFNFLVQPGDGMPAELLINGQGQADLFWIRWGYGHDPQDVITQLWDSSPLYRYRMDDGVLDPYKLDDTPGVSDPVMGAQLGMRNLERSMATLEQHEFAEPDPTIAGLLDAKNLHNAALEQWFVMHRQVLSLVGGRLMADTEKNSAIEREPTGRNRIPGGEEVDPEKQKEAVLFLCKSFFSNTPEFLLGGPIVRAAGLDRHAAEALVKDRREALYEELVGSTRINQMIRFSAEAKSPKESYGVSGLMRDLQGCVIR